FFSSRRRHTRLQGDWSSDVCSSDLNLLPQQSVITTGINMGANWQAAFFQINSNMSTNWVAADKVTVGHTRMITVYVQPMMTWKRSEERRVGKEGTERERRELEK